MCCSHYSTTPVGLCLFFFFFLTVLHHYCTQTAAICSALKRDYSSSKVLWGKLRSFFVNSLGISPLHLSVFGPYCAKIISKWAFFDHVRLLTHFNVSKANRRADWIPLQQSRGIRKSHDVKL